MRPAQIDIAQLEKFFNGINIPKVVKTNVATTFTDASKFVAENLELLKGKDLSDLIATTRYEQLMSLKKAILDPVK